MISLTAFSQVDYEFWFAAPYGNTDHAPYWPESYPYKVGGRPIYLRLATQDADADVTISLPALGITIANVQIAANSTQSIDLTPYIENIQCSNKGNVVEDKGIYIRSNALITAYYEIASVLNTDIFSLKGQNALGKEFYAPFQNKMVNDQYHNGEGVPDNGVYGDGAYSYIVIVATQDNTVVNITPTTNCVGITKGQTKAVRLDRGQTYVVRATGQDVNSRLSGTYIKSTKPVAVTIGEDSAYPDYYTNSGDCEDYIGDQIVPVSVAGKDYIVVQGQGYVAAKNTSKDFYEIVAITATKDNTIITLDGAQYGSALSKGQTISIELTDPETIYTFIHASEPVYAFHISGYHCEVAGALLPSVEMCTGSYKMGFVRTYGTQNDQEFYMNLMVKGDGEKDFLLNGAVDPTIDAAEFQSIEGTDWKVARIYFTQSALPEGAYFLQNTTSLFHMGMMNSTSHDWGDGLGYRLMGSMYGYFSRFSDNFPNAVIVNNNDTSITVTRGTKVSLLADGGYKFAWVGYMWNGYDWELMESPYKLNKTDVENPYTIVDAIGIYKYTATITTACYGDVEQSVLIKVVEPVDLNNVKDTVCYTPELGLDKSQYYNLFNLNDTIVGKKGLVTGFYVDHFDKYIDADTVIIDDYDDNRPMKSYLTVGNGKRTFVQNPDTTGIVGDTKVAHIIKNKQDWGDANTDPELSSNTGAQSVWLKYNYANDPLKLEYGTKFSFDVLYDSTTFSWGCEKDFQVFMEIIDDSKNVASIPCTTFPAICNSDTIGYQYEWQHVEANFEDYTETMGPITSIRIRLFFDNWLTDYGFYIDNLTYYTLGHFETILTPNAKNYTITDGDSLYAIVKNNFEVTRSDTSMVYLSVRNPGIEKREIQLADTCATNGSVLEEFNLTDYNYQTGGALVANREWYWDSQRTQHIDNPEYVDVEAGLTTFYVYVEDECADIPGKLTLQVYAIPDVQDAEVTICELPSLGGDRGLIDLTQMQDKVTTDLSATIEWYSDADYTKLVGTLSNIAVSDGTKFYAKVYNKITCPSYATLTINVTPVDDIVFDDFSICADAEIKTLTATPAGGTYTGDGVTGNQFDPSATTTGSHEITYTIENQGCTNSATAVALVNPTVTVSAVSSPKKIQQGQTATIQTTISPASSDYAITWTKNASLLADPTSANPTTVALTKPTYYTINVENTKTGCSASANVLVDVYAPVEVELNLEPVCAGKDVTIEAQRTGGTGPFTYSWTLSPATAYTAVNDSVILISNIQNTVEVTVTVTDQTEGDVKTTKATQVVYANPSITLDNAEVCQHETLNLTPTVTGGTTPYTHTWSNDTDILTTATNVQNATVNTDDNTGTYYLSYKVTDKNGCEAKKDISVIINAQPQVTATSDKEISCIGDIVNLQGTVTSGSTAGSVTHEWISSYASSLSSTSIPNPTLQSYISGALRFQYKFTDAKGCSALSNDITIQNNPNPTIAIDPIDPQCATTQGVQLSATASVDGIPTATFTYAWSGDVTSTEATPMLDISEAGTKTVNLQVTSNTGCTSSTTATVTVNPNPLAEIATTDVETCSSDTITMIANASSANVDYKWSGSLNWIKDNTSSVQAVIPANVLGNDVISYPVTLTVTDKTTSCKSTTTTNVNAHKIPQVTLGDNLEVCDGNEVELKPLLKYIGTENYTLTWFLDVTQLSSVNVENPIYTQKGTSSYNIGVQVTDENGCVGKHEIEIKGQENPTANAGIDREEDWNEPFTLSGSATGGSPTYSYLWSPKDSLTTAETLQNPTAKLRETTKFTLEVTDSKGCKGTDDVTITIVGQPLSVQIEQHPIPFCYGNIATLEAIPSGGNKGGTYTYDWYDMSNPSTKIGTTKSIEVSPTSATTYKVVLNSVGARPFDPAENTITVEVNPLPEISLRGGSNPHVCKGDLTNLIPVVSGASEPYSYEWRDGNPIVTRTETYQFSNSEIEGTQTITLVVTDNIGCADSLDINVRVDALPEITLDPVTECVNIETTVVAEATKGTSPYSYFWSGIQGMTSSSNKATFTISEDGTYQISVSVEDANQCKSEAETFVTIKPEATLRFDDSYSVCASEDLELVMNPNNISGFFTMHWVGGDKNRIVDSTKINRLISTFRSDNEGTYTLYYTIADEYNCPRLDSTKITVYPAVKLADIDDKVACAGVGLDIKAEIATGTPSSFTWLGNVSPKNEQTTTYSYTKPGEYQVTVIAGDQHCSDTKNFTVSVKQNPVVEIVGAPIKKVDYTEEVHLESKITTYTTYPFTHSWKEAANITSGATTDNIVTIPILQTTDYEYTIVDAYGCTAKASIRLQTEMIIPKITHFCDGKEYTISATELLDSNKVCLTDDGLELCEGESAYLIPQFISGENLENLTYAWYDDENKYLGDDINILITPTKYSTVYTLKVSNKAGFSTDARFTVIMHKNPTASITVTPDYNGKYYTNDILNINGNPSPETDKYTSIWTASPSVQIKDTKAQITYISGITEEIKPLTLTYEATNQYGCKAETTKEINVVEQKMPRITGDDVCIYSTSTYKLDQSYPAGTKYVWTVNGGTIQEKNADGSQITVYWTESENTTITVSIYPPDGSERVIEGITYTAHITPMPDVTINGQIHVCVGENAQYEAINNIPTMQDIKYSWRVADDHGDLVDISTPKSDLATVLWDKEGKDTVILRAMYGACIISDELTVYIHPTPDANFTYRASEDVYFMTEDKTRHTDSIFVDKEVSFTNLTTHHEGYDYFWDFIGDGVYTENSRDAVYEYDETGDFMVSLMVVENTWGCKNVIAKPLKVVPNPNCGLTFPNAFTPDLGENNTFYPVFKSGVLESGYELRVYNRWGTLLWSTNDLYGEWDGVYKGSISKQDVYVYHCKATCEDIDPETGEHRILNVKGDVTIIR